MKEVIKIKISWLCKAIYSFRSTIRSYHNRSLLYVQLLTSVQVYSKSHTIIQSLYFWEALFKTNSRITQIFS